VRLEGRGKISKYRLGQSGSIKKRVKERSDDTRVTKYPFKGLGNRKKTGTRGGEEGRGKVNGEETLSYYLKAPKV